VKRVVGNLVKSVTSGLILQQVNCQGVMGSGIAKELRETYPVVWETYRDLCSLMPAHQLLGQAQLVQVSDALYVANLFGQLTYGRDGRRYTSYDALDDALTSLGDQLVTSNLATIDIHHPLIGCGLGGGHWLVVEALIKNRLGDDTVLWVLG
jgi:O-acetyl-ADP-ribose deacetylase (regulator of RNase III)